MKAVLFAAGLGTRLYPHTLDKPKALVSIQGRPMLYRLMDNLYEAGIREYIVNVHAFAGQVENALEIYAQSKPGISIEISDERDLLLETGGGLQKMEALLKDEPFLVHNVDVLSDINLKLFIEQSISLMSTPYNLDLSFTQIGEPVSKTRTEAKTETKTKTKTKTKTESEAITNKQYPLAVLAVRNDFKDRCFLMNQYNLLCGWENRLSGEQKISRQQKGLHPVGFMGIHCISPSIFPLIQEEGVFSITDVYLRLARQQIILGLDQTTCRWLDIGSPEQLLLAEEYF